MLRSDQINAVYNPLPNNMHKEWSIKAAQYGKHVLCEKPITLNAAECLDLIAARDQYQVKMMEAFMYRFHPRTERALQMVKDGAIGDLKQVRSTFTFPLDRPDDIRWDAALGGGALMDVGCYCINVSRAIVGQEPVEVRAMANFRDGGVDQQMAGTLRFENGLFAHFDCALTMERSQVIHLLGTEGHLRVMEAFLPGTEDVVIEQFDEEDNLTKIYVDGADEYQLMVEHFADCVLKDQPLRYSAEESALNMKVIEALYKSARNEGDIAEV